MANEAMALWDDQMQLIKDAGDLFDDADLKATKHPKDFDLNDPHQWIALIEMNHHVHKAMALIAAAAPETIKNPAKLAELQVKEKDLLAADEAYQVKMEATKESDPHYYHAVQTEVETAMFLSAFSKSDPDGAKRVLDKLGTKHDFHTAGLLNGENDHLAALPQSLVSRMSEAMSELLQDHQGGKDTDGKTTDDGQAMQKAKSEQINQLLLTWKKLEKTAQNDADLRSDDLENRYASLWDELRKQTGGIETASMNGAQQEMKPAFAAA